MYEFIKYRLHDRSSSRQPQGLSCDENGLFIAGDVPIISMLRRVNGTFGYELRDIEEINLILSACYGVEIDAAGKMAHLSLIERYMNDGKWVLAKISAVQLGLPDLPDEVAIRRAVATHRKLKSGRAGLAKSRRVCRACRDDRLMTTRKGDVSNEPRVPAGQSGGGEWESGDGGAVSPKPMSNPMVIPTQALAPPIAFPWELPLPPTEITPFPISPTAPNVEPLNPTANPYPDRPECVKEWADAIQFCREKQRNKQFKPGYSGFGKNFQKCSRSGFPRMRRQSYRLTQQTERK